jgi:hypothetical protein
VGGRVLWWGNLTSASHFQHLNIQPPYLTAFISEYARELERDLKPYSWPSLHCVTCTWRVLVPFHLFQWSTLLNCLESIPLLSDLHCHYLIRLSLGKTTPKSHTLRKYIYNGTLVLFPFLWNSMGIIKKVILLDVCAQESRHTSTLRGWINTHWHKFKYWSLTTKKYRTRLNTSIACWSSCSLSGIVLSWYPENYTYISN